MRSGIVQQSLQISWESQKNPRLFYLDLVIQLQPESHHLTRASLCSGRVWRKSMLQAANALFCSPGSEHIAVGELNVDGLNFGCQ